MAIEIEKHSGRATVNGNLTLKVSREAKKRLTGRIDDYLIANDLKRTVKIRHVDPALLVRNGGILPKRMLSRPVHFRAALPPEEEFVGESEEVMAYVDD